MRAALLLGLAAIFATGCASDGYTRRGVEHEVRGTVNLAPLPEKTELTLLTTIDMRVARFLEEKRGEIVDAAIARYNKGHSEQTVLEGSMVAVYLESYPVEPECQGDPGDDRPRFMFTLRRAKTRILNEPRRVSTALISVENTRAPDDALEFQEFFHTELSRALDDEIRRTVEHVLTEAPRE